MANVAWKHVAVLASTAILWGAHALASNADDKTAAHNKSLLAAKTEIYSEKEGFERNRKDIINTLKDNESTSFTTLLDGYKQAFDLDVKLKEKGPYTVFAPNENAFKHINDEDLSHLFANKPKLKEVLSYEIVPGEYKSADLRAGKKLKTLEGHELEFTTKGNDIYCGKALIKTADIPCSNGVIHILDTMIWPPTGK